MELFRIRLVKDHRWFGRAVYEVSEPGQDGGAWQRVKLARAMTWLEQHGPTDVRELSEVLRAAEAVRRRSEAGGDVGWDDETGVSAVG